MHKHKEAQEVRVELNIGGHRFQTSVRLCGAYRTPSSTPISAVGTRKTCVLTIVSSWTVTASTSGTCWNS
jgi:hypothetical protein